MTAQSRNLSAFVEIVAGRDGIAERGSVSSCVRQKICFEHVTAFSLPLLLKKEERRIFLSVSPLSDSLPARSSRGEREAERRRLFAYRTQLLCEPQRVESDRRAGCAKTLGGRQSPCGSQTRAPLVAASPRCAVSQSCTVRGVGKFRCVGPSDALLNTIRRYSVIRQIEICATAASAQQAKQIRRRPRF